MAKKEQGINMETFTSKIDKELKKACMIHCIKKEINFIELLDSALSEKINYKRNK